MRCSRSRPRDHVRVDADALYALAPEDFTAARDAAARQARADGDRAAATALKALRRPSVSAWLVNRLATDHRNRLEELLALGPALAEAQSAGHPDELRALGRQRRMLVEAVADTALKRRVSTAAVRSEVVATLEAALADPASADAVRSGRLVRALSYAGFGGVDLAGAVAGAPVTVLAAGTSRSQAPDRGAPQARQPAAARAAAQRLTRAAVAAAEAVAHEASGRLDDAVRAAQRAERAATDASAALADAERVVTHASEALAAAQADREQAREAARDAAAAQAAALDVVRGVQDDAGQARSALDALRRT